MTKELFTIHIKFISGDTHVERHTEDSVVEAVKRLTLGPAAQMGMIDEVKVVDTLDCTNLLWQKGKLIWPRRLGTNGMRVDGGIC